MVDQDENESGNPGHTHPGASALLWGGVFYRERGESRVAPRLTDFSESEEDLSSDDPEQEGAAHEEERRRACVINIASTFMWTDKAFTASLRIFLD